MPDPTKTFRRGSGPGNPGGGSVFTPGTVLLERYRIIRLLGKGGMAEVYQADDLKLGEPVALKFLSTVKGSDGALDRLYRELRNGRKVAHPNVCRLYDIVEVGERHFITMEFVEGEDLAFVLRQVGRYPYEKAIRVARDLCAGVSAAHQVGLLHRDLKPANVMIDGRGTPKITDFGIAAFSHEIHPDDVSGTPNYMAPEQLAGKGVSVRSDLYSLGLVMQELFTGVPVFEADSFQELMTAHQAPKRSPSSVVSDLDAAVERVILKCVNEDPAQRPQSAREILAMLPGRDAIDAAVAAGETPSPQIVAAADVSSRLSVRAASLLFAGVILGLAAVLALTPLTMFYAHVPLEKSPEVLAENAQQVAAAIGMSTQGLRRYSWFERDEKYLRSRLTSGDSSRRDLRTLIPGVMDYVSYWVPVGAWPRNSTGRFRFESPLVLNHLNRVILDSAGRLKSFRLTESASAWPGYRETPIQALAPLAGLPDQPLNPVHQVRADDKTVSTEWSAKVDGQDPVHIVSRNRAGVLEFAVNRSEPSSNDQGSVFTAELGLSPAWGGAALFVLIIATVVIGIGLMFRNVRRGRIDASGAIKLGIYISAIRALSWACGADHSGRLGEEWVMFTTGVGGALCFGVLVWLLYSALEPSLRRRSPHMLVAWSRLMLGRFRDPLIARDVLIGIVVGIACNLWWRVINISPELWSFPPLIPYGDIFEAFSSVRGVGVRFFSVLYTAVFFGLGIVFILTSWLALTNRMWISFLGTAAAIVLVSYPTVPQVRPEQFWFAMIFYVGLAASFLWVTWRFGLLVLIVTIFVHFQLCAFPLTLDPDSWFVGRSWLALILLLAVAAWAAFPSLYRQPESARAI